MDPVDPRVVETPAVEKGASRKLDASGKVGASVLEHHTKYGEVRYTYRLPYVTSKWRNEDETGLTWAPVLGVQAAPIGV